MALENDEIQRLTKIYADAEKKLARAISKIDPAKPFAQTRKQFLAEVRGISAGLSEDSSSWSEKTIRKFYRTGSDSVIPDMKKANDKVITSFTSADEASVEALITDVDTSFGETMQGVGRSANQYLNQLRKQQILSEVGSDIVAGTGAEQIKRDIVDQISQSGFTAFKDRAGRAWSLSRYGEMLGRTTLMKARNEGAKVRLLSNGFRFAKVSRHADIDGWDICNEYEDQVVDLADPQIPLPPYHPNCRHTLQYIDELEIEDKAGSATTVDEAEAFAEKNIAKKVSYKGLDTTTANQLNRTMANKMKAFNIPRMKYVEVRKVPSKASMIYNPKENALWINRDFFQNNAQMLKAESLRQTLVPPAQKTAQIRKLKEIQGEWLRKLRETKREYTLRVNESTINMKKIYGGQPVDESGVIPKEQFLHILSDIEGKIPITLESLHGKAGKYKTLEQIRSDVLSEKILSTSPAIQMTKKQAEYFGQQLAELQNQSSRFTYSAGQFDLVPSVARHELGHALMRAYPKQFEQAKTLYSKLNLKGLSEYAKYSPEEMFAEAFSAYSVKDYKAVPPELLEILNTIK